MKLFTIGFTGKTAEEFFALLKKNKVRKVIDVRRNNTSQLAVFTRASDFPFFLDKVGGIEYEHRLDMAPSQELVKSYRAKEIDWKKFRSTYLKEIRKSKVAAQVSKKDLSNACLVCSEHEPEHCHRSHLAEHLEKELGGIEIVHLT